jgi:hypothetical protein
MVLLYFYPYHIWLDMAQRVAVLFYSLSTWLAFGSFNWWVVGWLQLGLRLEQIILFFTVCCYYIYIGRSPGWLAVAMS